MLLTKGSRGRRHEERTHKVRCVNARRGPSAKLHVSKCRKCRWMPGAPQRLNCVCGRPRDQGALRTGIVGAPPRASCTGQRALGPVLRQHGGLSAVNRCRARTWLGEASLRMRVSGSTVYAWDRCSWRARLTRGVAARSGGRSVWVIGHAGGRQLHGA